MQALNQYWLALAQGTPCGGTLTSQLSDADEKLRALGFNRQGDLRWQKQVDLCAVSGFIYSKSERLAGIDGVAIITIQRPGKSTPYIFATLRSLLAESPDEIIVNVFVGDENDDYLSEKNLANEVGAKSLQRIVVHPTSTETAAFLRANQGIKGRSTWNYARALRSYRGSKHLLLCEDDIEMSKGCVPTLARYLERTCAGLLSLYNYHCANLLVLDSKSTDDVRVVSYRSRSTRLQFGRTQCVAYSADLAFALGMELAVELGQLPYDMLIDRYLWDNNLLISFVQPSMVQHMGESTTGLGNFHQSTCYPARYPSAEIG